MFHGKAIQCIIEIVQDSAATVSDMAAIFEMDSETLRPLYRLPNSGLLRSCTPADLQRKRLP